MYGGPLKSNLSTHLLPDTTPFRFGGGWTRMGNDQHHGAFFPARPVRPDRCCKASASRGISTWMTRLSVGRSMPRAATSVATHTRARRSRSACSAWLRSFWLCSPDSEIGRAHVCTPVTNAHFVCRLLLEQKNMTTSIL